MLSPIASTRSGPVTGTSLPADDTHRQSVLRFCGIPFAASIAGPNRFRAPQPEHAWDEPRECTAWGDICPQGVSAMSKMLGASAIVTGDECLNLNVWTPGVDAAARPVMVWIHGGAYTSGSGSTPWYDGQRFAANHDVVVVTINYRLGALGFLDLSRVVPDVVQAAGSANPANPGDVVITPNCGLLDQIAALEWVQQCIAAFGGDPTNVTVFGESAGAMSIGALLGAPAAAGLFGRAILQSGAAAHISSPEQGERAARAFLNALGLTQDRASLAALATLPIEEITTASTAADTSAIGGGGLAWQPTIGTASLPEHPLDVVAGAAHAGIDVLFGTTTEEMRLFLAFDPDSASLDHAGIVSRLSRTFDESIAAAIAEGYANDAPDRSPRDTWVAISTDQVFRYPADQLARALTDGGANSLWAYEFAWQTPAFGGVLGSCHALEIPFVFDNLHQRAVGMFTGTGAERQGIADVMHHAWASFARHGNPNIGASPKAPEWFPWSPDDRTTFTIGVDVEVVDDPKGEALRRWPQ